MHVMYDQFSILSVEGQLLLFKTQSPSLLLRVGLSCQPAAVSQETLVSGIITIIMKVYCLFILGSQEKKDYVDPHPRLVPRACIHSSKLQDRCPRLINSRSSKYFCLLSQCVCQPRITTTISSEVIYEQTIICSNNTYDRPTANCIQKKCRKFSV